VDDLCLHGGLNRGDKKRIRLFFEEFTEDIAGFLGVGGGGG